MKIELEVHAVGERMPDADTDVLLWAGGEPCSMLGAYVGEGQDGAAGFVDAQGGAVADVTHWAEMPQLQAPAGAAVHAGPRGDRAAAAPLQRCASNNDGDCAHAQCPQLRDAEPATSGRSCPLWNTGDPYQ